MSNVRGLPIRGAVLFITFLFMLPQAAAIMDDYDGDGVWDENENESYSGDTDSDGDGIDDGQDDDLDSDLDGLDNSQEHILGTNVNLPDSDWDGVTDFVEAAASTDPLDPLDGGLFPFDEEMVIDVNLTVGDGETLVLNNKFIRLNATLQVNETANLVLKDSLIVAFSPDKVPRIRILGNTTWNNVVVDTQRHTLQWSDMLPPPDDWSGYSGYGGASGAPVPMTGYLIRFYPNSNALINNCTINNTGCNFKYHYYYPGFLVESYNFTAVNTLFGRAITGGAEVWGNASFLNCRFRDNYPDHLSSSPGSYLTLDGCDLFNGFSPRHGNDSALDGEKYSYVGGTQNGLEVDMGTLILRNTSVAYCSNDAVFMDHVDRFEMDNCTFEHCDDGLNVLFSSGVVGHCSFSHLDDDGIDLDNSGYDNLPISVEDCVFENLTVGMDLRRVPEVFLNRIEVEDVRQYGIYATDSILECRSVSVVESDDAAIRLMDSSSIIIHDSHLEDGPLGLWCHLSSRDDTVEVKNTTINTDSGVDLSGPIDKVDVVFEGCTISGNVSNSGLVVQNANLTIEECAFFGEVQVDMSKLKLANSTFMATVNALTLSDVDLDARDNVFLGSGDYQSCGLSISGYTVGYRQSITQNTFSNFNYGLEIDGFFEDLVLEENTVEQAKEMCCYIHRCKGMQLTGNRWLNSSKGLVLDSLNRGYSRINGDTFSGLSTEIETEGDIQNVIQITGCHFLSLGTGIIARDVELVLDNTTMIPNTGDYPDLQLDENSLIRLVNTTYSPGMARFDDTTSSLEVQQRVSVTVLDGNGLPIEDAQVTFRPDDSWTSYKMETDEDGFVQTRMVTWEQRKTYSRGYNPYTITATAQGVGSNSTVVSLDGDTDILLLLRERNLRFGDVWTEPENPAAGEEFVLYVEIFNDWAGTSDVVVRLSGDPYKIRLISELQSGGSAVVNFTLTKTDDGDISLQLILDPYDDVQEDNEDDNTMYFDLTIWELPTVTGLNVSSSSLLTGEDVQITVMGEGEPGPLVYQVDFGDGTISDWSALGTFIHNYTVAGEYTLLARCRTDLGVTGEWGKPGVAMNVTQYIPPNLRPVADFTITPDPKNGTINTEFTFDASPSRDPDGWIRGWRWDFGDGANSTRKIPSHTYSEDGMYVVSLQVMDNHDNWSRPAYMTVHVDNLPPSIDVEISRTEGKVGDQFVLDLSRTSDPDDEGDLVFEVDFGDGPPETTSSDQISHRYDEPGTYTIRVRAIDDDGDISTWSGDVVVEGLPEDPPKGELDAAVEGVKNRACWLVPLIIILAVLSLMLVIRYRNYFQELKRQRDATDDGGDGPGLPEKESRSTAGLVGGKRLKKRTSRRKERMWEEHALEGVEEPTFHLDSSKTFSLSGDEEIVEFSEKVIEYQDPDQVVEYEASLDEVEDFDPTIWEDREERRKRHEELFQIELERKPSQGPEWDDDDPGETLQWDDDDDELGEDDPLDDVSLEGGFEGTAAGGDAIWDDDEDDQNSLVTCRNCKKRLTGRIIKDTKVKMGGGMKRIPGPFCSPDCAREFRELY